MKILQAIKEFFMDDDWDCPEDHVTFNGCTCDHDPEEHGWSQCEVEGCECEGCWEE